MKTINKTEADARTKATKRVVENCFYHLLKKHPELETEFMKLMEKQFEKIPNMVKREGITIKNETVVLAKVADLKDLPAIDSETIDPKEYEAIKEKLSPALKAYVEIEGMMKKVINRISHRYKDIIPGSRDELKQEGYLAFLVAFNSYDVETCNDFYGYATVIISRYMFDYIVKNLFSDGANKKLCRLCFNYTKLVEKNPTITIEEIAEKLEITPKYAKRIVELVQQRYDLYRCDNNTEDDDDDDDVRSDRSSKTIARICYRYNMPVAAQSAEDAYMDSHDTTDDILSNIKDDKERAIFADFAGCNDKEKALSLRKLEEKYGYGRDKISRIIKKNQKMLQNVINM